MARENAPRRLLTDPRRLAPGRQLSPVDAKAAKDVDVSSVDGKW